MLTPSCSVSMPVAWSISARYEARPAGWPPGPPLAQCSPGPVLGVEQQHGGGIGEDQRVPELEVAQRAGPVPVQAKHPGPDRPDHQREREDRRRPGPARRRRERRPAGPRFPVGQVRGQHRAAGGGRIEQGPFPEGQLQLGELPADLVGHLHQVTRLRVPRGAQPGTGDLNPGNHRRAHVRGRHLPAPPRPPAPRPVPRPCQVAGYASPAPPGTQPRSGTQPARDCAAVPLKVPHQTCSSRNSIGSPRSGATFVRITMK